MITLYQRARNRWPDQRPHSNNRKTHPIPRPNSRHILGQTRQHRREHALEPRYEEPIRQ